MWLMYHNLHTEYTCDRGKTMPQHAEIACISAACQLAGKRHDPNVCLIVAAEGIKCPVHNTAQTHINIAALVQAA